MPLQEGEGDEGAVIIREHHEVEDDGTFSQDDGPITSKSCLTAETVKSLLKEMAAMCTVQVREMASLVGVSSAATEKDIKGAFSGVYRWWSASIRVGGSRDHTEPRVMGHRAGVGVAASCRTGLLFSLHRSVIGELDEELDANLDLSKLRAQPLKPVIH
ncbi:hypothetical protein Taro_032330 [Colocasia esculenta]|uniref:Uncharacterized protein n=1 Tax=Colocasia esculenta TaxID=4460 RepID=A0A843VSE7_COLES|nr:hypothetical protein [Colocasia esculenta]